VPRRVARQCADFRISCLTTDWQEFLPSAADEYRVKVTHGRCTMVHAFVMSQVDYCNSILHRVSAANVQPLQNVLSAVVRITARLITLPVHQRIEYKVCVLLLVFKCLYQAAPTYLTELCSPVSESANRGHLRSAARGDLVMPRSRTTRYGRRRFAVFGPILWNSLPLSLGDPSLTPSQFCALLKTVLFCRAYGTLT